MPLHTVNPATGAPLAQYNALSGVELGKALDDAVAGAAAWAKLPLPERLGRLAAFGKALRERVDPLARLASEEMGKPVSQARLEVEKCAWTCEHYAKIGEAGLNPEKVKTEASAAYVDLKPLGVILAIMPWNFPYWQVVRAAIAPMAVGNTFVVKHAERTTGCALALVEAAKAAGCGDAIRPLLIEVDRVPRVIADDRIAAVTLTGSTRAGRAVAAAAGAALKKTVLELGGSDPFLVLADADLDAAAAWLVRARFQNTGQSCIAAKRLIVEESVADALLERVLAQVGKLVVGDPLDPKTTIGPIARADLRDEVAAQVADAVARGGKVRAGGQVLDRPGFFYAPTVIDRVGPGFRVVDEEVFGPVLPLVRVRDEAEAVRVANTSRFGLGSAVWTRDLDRGRAIARALACGYTAVNGITASDPRLPFGGVRDSGYGRELSWYGLHELSNAQAVVVNEPTGPKSSGGLDLVE